jgi:YbbR domain-containing protein
MEIANLYTFSALILFLVTSLENHCPTPAIKVIANNRNVTVTKLSCNLRYDHDTHVITLLCCTVVSILTVLFELSEHSRP